MDDIEFKSYDSENQKRIGPHDYRDDDNSTKTPDNKNRFQPKSYTVIIIVAIAILFFFSYKWYQKNSLFPKQTKSELDDIRNALFQYKESFHAYPNQLTELAKGRPLRESWMTDAWENPYRYEVKENNQTFIVTSSGGDGKFGTDDDIQIK